MFFIEEQWNGNIRPNQKAIRKDSQYHKLIHNLSCETAKFLEDMSTEQKKQFDDMSLKQAELYNIESRETFIEGFRLGVGLVLDAIGEYKPQLCSIGEEE